MTGTRQCEFCKDWTPEYLEEFYGVSDMECGACNGTKQLGVKDCFCCAYEPGECACDADWGDFIYEDDHVSDEDDLYIWEEQDWEENKYVYEYDLEYLTEMAVREKM